MGQVGSSRLTCTAAGSAQSEKVSHFALAQYVLEWCHTHDGLRNSTHEGHRLAVGLGNAMFGKETATKRPSPYATSEEFSHIFETDTNRLYGLSFLLTADEAIAEQCLVGGLHIAQEGTPVFREWAEAWARRAIILNAIRMIRPRITANIPESLGRVAGDYASKRTEIADVLALPVFERFVFVMSVLEGYSDHECALHLGCARAEIIAARTSAVERIASAAEFRGDLVTISSADRTVAARLHETHT